MTNALAAALLPKQSSTPYELADLGAMIEAWPVDPAEVERQSDPMRCDAELLPWLAFDKGVTIWSDDWPEAKQRRVIRDWWIYLRLQGTPLGVEAYLNLAGGRVIAEHLPPGFSFAMPDDGLTHQQVLDLMPQVRLYHRFPPQLPNRAVAFADVSFADRCAALDSPATVLGRYPVLYDPATGGETPLQVGDIDLSANTVTFHFPSYGRGAAFANVSFADVDCLGDPRAAAPIVFDLADPNLVTVRDTTPLPRKAAAADRTFADDSFADPDVGDPRTYDRLYVFDPTRVPPHLSAARAAAFADVSYVGIAPYNQLLRIVVPGTPARVKPGAAFADSSYADMGAFAFDASDRTNHDFALTAIATAKRAGDRILVELAPSFAGTRDAALPSMRDL